MIELNIVILLSVFFAILVFFPAFIGWTDNKREERYRRCIQAMEEDAWWHEFESDNK